MATEARALFMMRADALLQVHMPKALGGSVASAELCRKIAESQARVHGLLG